MPDRTGARPFAIALPVAVLLVALTETLRVPGGAYAGAPGTFLPVLGKSVLGTGLAASGVVLFGLLTLASRLGKSRRAVQFALVGLGAAVAGGSMVATVATNPKLARLVSLHALFVALVVVAIVGVGLAVAPRASPSRHRRRLHAAWVVVSALGTAVILWLNPRIHQHYPAFHVALVAAAVLLAFTGLMAGLTLRGTGAGTPAVPAAWVLLCAALATLGSVHRGELASSYYLAHTMPGLWSRAFSPGRPVPTADPAPDPAWTVAAGTAARFLAGARLPDLPEGFDLGQYNVLLITGEATRFDATSLGGQPPGMTPALAELAGEALSLTRGYAPSSGTLHSMSAVHGMAIPSVLHVETWRRSWNGQLHPDEPRLAKAFVEAGYQTFWIGHNYKLAFDEVILGFQDGFQDVVLEPSHKNAVDTDTTVADRVVERLSKPGGHRFFGWVFLVSPHSNYVSHYEDMSAARTRDLYQQEVRFMDEQLGRILAGLRRTGLLDQTVVVFTGDHGEEFGEHGGTYHKRTVYEESTHVPIVVRVPGMRPQISDGPTSVAYILPWLMQHGPPAVAKVARERISRTFVPLMRATEDAVIVELLGHEIMSTGLIWPDRKVIYDFYSGRTEVYDHGTDPGDQEDLALDPAVRGEVQSVLSRYRSLRSSLARYVFRPRYEPTSSGQ